MSKNLYRILGFLLSINVVMAIEAPIVIPYEVSYLGIPLLNMTLTWVEDDTSVRISYDNQLKPYIAYFHPIHNIYNVHFRRDSFWPLSWSKTVSEGDMNFQLDAQRSSNGKKVHFSNGYNLDFPPKGYTVFSATHYLANKANESEFFPVTLAVFIDGEIWEATATRYDTSRPHPEEKIKEGEVLIQADLHYLSGQSLVEKNDILTSVIAQEGTQFLLWVNSQGTFTQAQFGKFPKTVVLKQIGR